MNNDIGRNDPCPCGSIKPTGEPKKYKKCCLRKDKKKRELKNLSKGTKQFEKDIFVSGPYKICPQCNSENTFGVSVLVGDTSHYTRKCTACSYTDRYELPEIDRKIVYLDQFVISNLVKLLDPSQRSHSKIKKDPFWRTLFVKLEKAFKSQAIICPSSFYHREETLVSDFDFFLVERLYNHFSNGKTLFPSPKIKELQLARDYKNWLQGKETDFDFDKNSIAFEKLDSWSVGLQINVGHSAYNGEVERLMEVNRNTENDLKNIWERWSKEKDMTYEQRAKQEALGLRDGLLKATGAHREKKNKIMQKIAQGKSVEDVDLLDILPPPSSDILQRLMYVSRTEGVKNEQIASSIMTYLSDAERLLNVPYMKVSSIMFAGLARKAALGQKKIPNSTVDVQFISSYLPYSDAMFVDIESKVLLDEQPKNTPAYLQVDYPTKIFSIRQKQEFLNYLDEIVESVPDEIVSTLKDISGENYHKPYWDILIDEKASRELREEREQ